MYEHWSVSPHPWSVLPLCPCAKTKPPSSYTCLPPVILNLTLSSHTPYWHFSSSRPDGNCLSGEVEGGKKIHYNLCTVGLRRRPIVSRRGGCHVWLSLHLMTAIQRSAYWTELCQMFGSVGMCQKVFGHRTVHIWHQRTLQQRWGHHDSDIDQQKDNFCFIFVTHL